MKVAYESHKNLKVAAAELGMKFQTLYWHLTKNGVPVCGDKERWGSEKDKFADTAEKAFAEIVGISESQNKATYQAKIDFIVNGIKVDVKAAKIQSLGVGSGGDRWAFSIKKQLVEADFFVMFGYSADKQLMRIFLIPKLLLASTQSISISVNGRSKWHDYEVTREQLAEFFNEVTA